MAPTPSKSPTPAMRHCLQVWSVILAAICLPTRTLAPPADRFWLWQRRELPIGKQLTESQLWTRCSLSWLQGYCAERPAALWRRHAAAVVTVRQQRSWLLVLAARHPCPREVQLEGVLIIGAGAAGS